MRRTFDAKNPNDKAVSYVCLDYAGGHQGDPAWAERSDFFEHNCPNGMRAQVMFPPCWNGKDLYKADGSHMSYPVGNHEFGYCPSTHKVRFITVRVIVIIASGHADVVRPQAVLRGSVQRTEVPVSEEWLDVLVRRPDRSWFPWQVLPHPVCISLAKLTSLSNRRFHFQLGRATSSEGHNTMRRRLWRYHR